MSVTKHAKNSMSQLDHGASRKVNDSQHSAGPLHILDALKLNLNAQDATLTAACTQELRNTKNKTFQKYIIT
jgi:hypothetical protein